MAISNQVELDLATRMRRALATVALIIAVVMGFSMSSQATTKADAAMGTFCWGSAVGPWGQCTAGWGQYLWSVHAKGGQHSGCVNAYYSGSLVSSWACAPTNEWAFIGFNGTRWMQGTARDNSGNSNVLYGEMWY